MNDNSGFFLTLLIGLFSVIWFKKLGKFTHNRGKGFLPMLQDKWDIIFLQVNFFIGGSLFFTASLAKLLPLLGIDTSQNLLDWLLAFWSIYLVSYSRQVSKFVLRFQQK